MDTFSAFAMGQANMDKPLKVFDWNNAARLINQSGLEFAEAGLEGDWEWTGGTIFSNGAIVPPGYTYTYLASTWATPQLFLGDEYIDCWQYEEDLPGWDADTYWPQSARDILAGRETVTSI